MIKFLKLITLSAFFTFIISISSFANEVDYKNCFTSDVVISKGDADKWVIKDSNYNFFSLEKCNEKKYVSAAMGLNIRRVPTTDSIPVLALPYGEEVTVIGSQIEENNLWVMIEYADSYAFVWSAYLTDEKPITQLDIETSSNNNSDMTYLGNYMCTAYEWTGDRCANGNWPQENYTVACNSLPFGTEIYIEGYGYYVVEDRGGGGDQWIDIYMGDVSTCNNFGVRYLDIYLVN